MRSKNIPKRSAKGEAREWQSGPTMRRGDNCIQQRPVARDSYLRRVLSATTSMVLGVWISLGERPEHQASAQNKKKHQTRATWAWHSSTPPL
eukprot:scaffold28599_cov26-Tisochrysis_lutea.AAC.2